MAAAGLGLLALIAMVILSWILFHKRYDGLTLSHAIMASVAFLLMALGLVWVLGVKKGLLSNKSANPMMTLVVFLGSILFACYFLGAALYLWIYRMFFENY